MAAENRWNRRMEPGSSGSIRTAADREPTPIWLAALIATRCQANAPGSAHTIAWETVSGRAVYTNLGSETEYIHPFGLSLDGGHTVSVTWTPGDTAYTVEIHRSYDRCA